MVLKLRFGIELYSKCGSVFCGRIKVWFRAQEHARWLVYWRWMVSLLSPKISK